MLVFVAFLEKNYYWVSKYAAKTKTYFQLVHAITAEEVPQAVIRAHKTTVELSTRVHKRPRNVGLPKDLYETMQKEAAEHYLPMNKYIELILRGRKEL